MIDNSHDGTNFPHRFLLTNGQALRLRKVFTKNLLVNIKLSKTQSSKIEQSETLLGRLIEQLLKTCLSLMKNVRKPLANFITIRTNRRTIGNRCTYSKENVWIWYDNINNFEWRSE